MTERNAYFVPPSLEMIQRHAALRGVGETEAARELLVQRERLIGRAKDDPLNFGFVPPVWLVVDALLGTEAVPERCVVEIAERFGRDAEGAWEWWSGEVRGRLELERPVRDLLINGANRSGKTQKASDLTVRELLGRGGMRAVIGSQKSDTSVEVQQKRMYEYFPPGMRCAVRGDVEYHKFSDKNGFTGSSFVMGNGSRAKFHFYTQNILNIEGKEFERAWMDEEVPVSWLNALRMRLATVRGKLIVTFTPLSGYTPAVAQYLDGMKVVRWSQGYMLPRDGGEPSRAAALGLSEGELEVLDGQMERDELTTVPWSRPEDCLGWVEGEWDEVERNAVEGRVWELVPRVAVCAGGVRAVVWFHGRDNPFGNPSEVILTAQNKSVSVARDEIKKKVYGIALGAKGARYAAFERRVHVCRREEVPEGGFSVLVADTAPERNWFMGWFRVVGGRAWMYREWPGGYDVPGEGVPERWAVDSDRKAGANDGDPGGGQRSFKWGLLRYKFEIARLEGWGDFREWEASGEGVVQSGGWLYPDEEDLAEWADDVSDEGVEYRQVDPRACMASKLGMREDRTLIDMLNDLGMTWEPACGTRIVSGETEINELLDYVEGEDGDIVRAPRLMVCEDCANTIEMFEKYKGVEGEKGAMKDPSDVVRYFASGGFLDEGEGDEREWDEGREGDVRVMGAGGR